MESQLNTKPQNLKKSYNNALEVFEIKKIKNQKKWTKEEDGLLIELAKQFKEKHWKEISENFVRKNALQCFSRYKRIKPGIVKGSWKKEEDMKIIELVQKHGKVWSRISKALGTRNGKQIRDRYINVLDPEIKKGKFSLEEDEKLIELYLKYGPKWATIAKFYPDRTADMIKNRFHSSVKKRISSAHNTTNISDNNGAIKQQVNRYAQSALKICYEDDDHMYLNQQDEVSELSSEMNRSQQQNVIKNDVYMNYNNTNSPDSEEMQSYASHRYFHTAESSEKEIKTDENFLGANDELMLWNFEDYFSI